MYQLDMYVGLLAGLLLLAELLCFFFACLQMQWLYDNYETAEGVSLPRSTLYNHYLRHCAANKIDAVNAASFGKLIRSVFIGLKTRRLGTRYINYRCMALLLCTIHA